MAFKDYGITLDGFKKAFDQKQNVLDANQNKAVNSGITTEKVSAYDAHTANEDIHVTADEKEGWSNKQSALTPAQLAAANSGIDNTKVGVYSDHVANVDIHVTQDQKESWTGKQDGLSLEQMTAVNSGADSTKIAQITTNRDNITTLTEQVSGLSSVIGVKVEDTMPATPVKNTLYFIGTESPYHKYLVDNDGNIKDMGTGDVDLSQYYKKTETDTLLNGKLSLTGGTMTGALTFDSNVHYIINSNADNSWFGIFAGTDSNGSGFFLNGKNTQGSNPGTFVVKTAAAGGYTAKYLMGYPNGNLTWDGKNILTETTGDARYLPLTGGNLSGTVNFTSTATNPTFIKRNVDTDAMRICGGTADTKGARLALMGKDISTDSYKGAFFLEAHDGTNLKRLFGKPNGTLTWDDKDIATAETLANYLPLSGGTMTGTILTTANIGLRRPDDSAMMWIGTGTDANLSGNPNIRVFGKSNTNAGCIYLDANKGGSSQTVMILKPDGTLTWGTKDIYHGGNLVANPTGTGTTDLTKLQLGSTIYNVGGSYLPLTGGTMTGPIASSIANIINSTVDNSEIQINGGSGYEKGARFVLGGKSRSSNPGSFLIDACNGSVTKRLEGYCDGTLKWCGNKVLTATTAGVISDALTLAAETTLTNGVITTKEKNLIIKHSNTVDYTTICGATSSKDGASIALNGGATSTNSGDFVIRAATTESDTKVLRGKPSGSLTWDSNDIYHGGNLVANPTETATTPLSKIQLGSTVYSVTTGTFSIQDFYDGLYPINGPDIIGFAAPGVPAGVVATWTEVSTEYEGRYFKVSSTDAAGTEQDEQLPNITANMKEFVIGSNTTSDGAFTTSNVGGACSYNGSGEWKNGRFTFSASTSNSVYTDGGAVRPLTTTLKAWRRTA